VRSLSSASRSQRTLTAKVLQSKTLHCGRKSAKENVTKNKIESLRGADRHKQGAQNREQLTLTILSNGVFTNW
jgi:hypothetical protein